MNEIKELKEAKKDLKWTWILFVLVILTSAYVWYSSLEKFWLFFSSFLVGAYFVLLMWDYHSISFKYIKRKK